MNVKNLSDITSNARLNATMTMYNRGDLIKDYKGRKGIIIKGNTLYERFVDVYVFGFGEKIMHDTRIELLSAKE
jgi:hypothetical protein